MHASEALSQEQEIISLRQEIAQLKEQLAWFKRQIFGPRSDRVIEDSSHQLKLPGMEDLPVPEPEKQDVKPHKRKKAVRDGHDTVSVPADLPVERIILDIPDSEKICKQTGQALVKIGEDITRKLAIKPAQYYLKEFIRIKYALPEGSVLCQDLPDFFLPRCLADESLLAEVLVRKFADHHPLYRAEESFARDGIMIPRQVLSQWVLAAAEALMPLYSAMKAQVLKSKAVFVDETPVDLLEPGRGKVKEAYMLVLAESL